MNLSKIAISMLTILCMVSILKAEGTTQIVPKLESVFKVDACAESNKKEVLVLINIGDIKRSDSLFGFNFELKYDPGKIRFETVIWQNTIAEFFEIKQSNVSVLDSSVYGVAGHLSPSLSPVEGNDKALAAIYGYWLGDCPDSTMLSLSYLEYTEEFKKVNIGYEPTWVYSEILDKPERAVNYKFDTDEVKFQSDSLIDVLLKLDVASNEPTRLNFELELSNQEFEIVEVVSLDTLNIIENLTKTQNGYFVDINKVKPVLNGLKISIKNKGTIGEYLGTLQLHHIGFGDCDCITRNEEDEVSLHSLIKDDTTSVFETPKYKAVYSNLNKMIIVRTSTNDTKNIKLYNLQGKLVEQLTTDRNHIEINAEHYENGLYLLEIVEQDKKQIINLIKY